MTSGDYHPMPEGSPESVLRLTDELEAMLGRYLSTISEDEAEEALAEFDTPRNQQVDDLLRRVELDKQPTAVPELEQSLRDHLTAVENGAYSAPTPSEERSKWRKRTASDIHRMVTVSDRVRSYVELVAVEDESLHSFDDDHDSTIKGMGPPNAPLTDIGAKHTGGGHTGGGHTGGGHTGGGHTGGRHTGGRHTGGRHTGGRHRRRDRG